MKKLLGIVLVLAVVLSALTACSGNFKGVENYDGEVSSNGGFAVVKGEYVYFINGLASSTDDNTFGKVTKGALVRAKLADVKDFGKTPASEVVVPKLIYTDYDSANKGFYIFGDYVYYTTPSADKDKTGTVQNTIVNFTRTKLDGTDTSVIASAEGLSTPYRYVAKGSDVYLTVYTTRENSDGDSENALITYDVKGKEVKTSKAVSTYVFSDDAANAYAFYEKKAYNENLGEDEDFNEVYRYSLVGEDEVLVLSGAGMYTSDSGIGTQGANFAFVKYTAAQLYLTETFVDTSVSTIKRYYGVNVADLTASTAENLGKLVLLNKGTSQASKAFASDSVYHALDSIIYNDSTYGLVRYNYNEQDDLLTFGVEKLLYSEDLMSYTYCYDDGAYMYYYGNSYYYRIAIADVLAGNENIQQLTYTPTSGTGDFYRFEIIDNAILILNNNDPMEDYICAYDINALAGKDKDAVDKFIEDFAASTKTQAKARLNYRIGVFTEEDETAANDYIDANYTDDSAAE